MENRKEIVRAALISAGLAVTALLVLAVASNLALLLAKLHDGGFHVFTIFKLLQSSDRHVAGWAKISLLMSGIGAFMAVVGVTKKRAPALHGKARFATEKEIAGAGLRAKSGILVGKKNGRYLIFGGNEHVMVYAPTRGGKGVGIVIPNLLNWHDSAIILDIKKENWQLTAGFRAQYGKVFLFDPLDPEGKTARYNPLFYVNRENTVDIYDDLQRIGAMLLPVEKNGDAFFTRAARTGFLAIAGYIAETPELPFTIGEVYRQLAASPNLKDHFLKIFASREAEGNPLSRQCRTAMNDFLAASDNTFQSVRKTISAQLELWNNARIDKATAENDFDLRELRRKRMSLYIGVTPDNLMRMAPLINLLFQQAVDLNTRTLPEHDKSLKHQVMLMLDEFPAIGNVEVIQKGVAYVAGYGLRLVTIVQSPSQLFAVYGEYEARNYLTNHAIEVVYTPKELSVSKELSERFGTDTIKSRSVSRGLGFKAASTNKSQSESDHGRALMLPQELVLTPFEKEYVVKGGVRPVEADKILYFKDKVFTSRIVAPPKLRSIYEPDVQDQAEAIGRLEKEIVILKDRMKVLAENVNVVRPVQIADIEDIRSGKKTVVLSRPLDVDFDELAHRTNEFEFSDVELEKPDIEAVEALREAVGLIPVDETTQVIAAA